MKLEKLFQTLDTESALQFVSLCRRRRESIFLNCVSKKRVTKKAMTNDDFDLADSAGANKKARLYYDTNKEMLKKLGITLKMVKEQLANGN